MTKPFLFVCCLPIALAVASTACSSSDDGDDSPSGPVSFRNDVAPTLRNSCGLSSSCHAVGSNNGVVFGGEAAAVRAGLVGVKAPQLPTMNFVTAGDPAQSYIVHKLEGDQPQFAASCTKPGCGDRMPLGQDPLPQASRDAIRRWISEGAADN